jgi:hypothetical protein
MDFTEGFKPRKNFVNSNQRLQGIKQTMKERKELPLVELNKVKDEYYVVDGHHRIAAAKELGRWTIDAHIVEYLLQGDNPEDQLYRTRTFFEIKTGLQNIQLSHINLYSVLLDEIKRYHKQLEVEGKTFTLADSARNWYWSIYRPAMKELEEADILQYFNNLTVGDLYLYLRQHHILSSRKPSSESSDDINRTGLSTKFTREFSYLLHEDPYLDSDETLRRCKELLPSTLYSNFNPSSINRENSIRSAKRKLVKIVSET